MKREISISRSEGGRQYIKPIATVIQINIEAVMLNSSIGVANDTYDEDGEFEDL